MPKTRSSGPSSVRLEHVLRLLRHRFGPTLTDLDDADLLVEPIAGLLVAVRRERGLPVDASKVVDRLAELAPSIDRNKLEVVTTRALASTRPLSTAELGEWFKVSVAERETLRAWQLRPAGMSADQWRAAQRERERERGERRRREKGMLDREQYLARAAMIKRLAADHRVTTQTIRNWIKKGWIASPSGIETADFASPSGVQNTHFASPSSVQSDSFASSSGRKTEQADELQTPISTDKFGLEKAVAVQAPEARGALVGVASRAVEVGNHLLRLALYKLYEINYFEVEDTFIWRTHDIGARVLESYTDLTDQDIVAAASAMAEGVLTGKFVLCDESSELAAIRAVARQRFEKSRDIIPF